MSGCTSYLSKIVVVIILYLSYTKSVLYYTTVAIVKNKPYILPLFRGLHARSTDAAL